MLKALVISNMYPSNEHPVYGGFVQEQVEALRAEGIHIDIAAIQDRRKGLRVNIRKYMKLIWDIFGKAGLQKYNLYHVHYFLPTALFILPFSILFRTPFIVTAHGGDVRLAKKHPLLGRLSSVLLKRAYAVIAVSHALAKDISDTMKIPLKSITVASCGVNLTVFHPYEKNQARSDLRIPLKSPVIQFIGNFAFVKGLGNLLDAMPNVLKKHPDALLCLLGEGPLKPQLQAKAEGLGISESCFWFSPIPHNKIPLFLSAADIFVLPSLHEGFGLVALEASACGVPVVASHVGGIPEIIKDGENGILVEPENSEMLAEAINALLGNQAMRQQFAIAGQKLARCHEKGLQIRKVKDIYFGIGGSVHEKN